jgi:hypothetical protein
MGPTLGLAVSSQRVVTSRTLATVYQAKNKFAPYWARVWMLEALHGGLTVGRLARSSLCSVIAIIINLPPK